VATKTAGPQVSSGVTVSDSVKSGVDGISGNKLFPHTQKTGVLVHGLLPVEALMLPHRIEVFFYGLFMDADLLRTKGAEPVKIRPACAPGFALRIGQRATLLRNPDSFPFNYLEGRAAPQNSFVSISPVNSNPIGSTK
jgi:hypothetical protein